MGLLEGRTAVVTGAARGIGLEIARTFIANGARVVVGDIDDEAGAAAVAELGGEAAQGPVEVEGNPSLLSSVFRNLADNAAAYSGGIGELSQSRPHACGVKGT